MNKLYKQVYSGQINAALWISPWVVTLYCNLLHNNICSFDTALAAFENVIIDKWIGINKNLLLICRDICTLQADIVQEQMNSSDRDLNETQEMLVQRFFDYRHSRVFVDRDS